MKYPEIDIIDKEVVEIPKDKLLDGKYISDFLCLRSGGCLSNKGFFLASTCDWIIVKDDMSRLVLVPLKKD